MIKFREKLIALSIVLITWYETFYKKYEVIIVIIFSVFSEAQNSFYSTVIK